MQVYLHAVELHDNNVLFITLAGTLMLSLLFGFFFVFITMYRRRQLEFENRRLRREQEFATELQLSQAELSEKVMRNISEEIHDNIGQSLTLAKLQLLAIDEDEFAEKARPVADLISKSLHDLRDLSKSLNGDFIVRNGFRTSLLREAEVVNRSGLLKCAVNGDWAENHLQPEHEIILFRCIQEAISNVLKHSGARNLCVTLMAVNDKNVITVQDDGGGMDMLQAEGKGLGLSGMRRRVALLNGEFDLTQPEEGGTKICIKLLPPNQNRLQ